MEEKDQLGTPNSGKKGYPNTPWGPTVSPIAHSAMKNNLRDYEFNFSKLTSVSDTPKRGQFLGIVRPLWVKAKESECRAIWLEDMVRKKLIVRNIESYAVSLRECYRSDKMKNKKEEEGILFELMKVKLKDEKLHLQKLKRMKENVRAWLKEKLGKSRQYETLMRRLRQKNVENW